MTVDGVNRARAIQTRGLLDVLRHVHAHPGTTRADLARALGLSRGSAAEITSRLRALALVEEGDAAPSGGRGRPTRALGPHPDGPVVAVVDLSHEAWRLAVTSLGGEYLVADEDDHHGAAPHRVLAGIRRALDRVATSTGHRLQAVGVAVPGTVSGDQLLQASTLGWHHVDVAEALRPRPDIPVVVGNNATLAGVAEARRGAAVGADVALHLTVQVGIGGILLHDGRPITGSTGAGGEFGHLPFGDPERACPCGAHGCWDLEVDARALVRHLDADTARDPRTAAGDVLARARRGDTAARAAVDQAARRLGRGVAGLVNALDPRVVTFSGLGPHLLDLAGEAVDASYRAGLMRFRRADPPPLRPAVFPDDGSLRGAAELAFDQVLSEVGIDTWRATLPDPPG